MILEIAKQTQDAKASSCTQSSNDTTLPEVVLRRNGITLIEFLVAAAIIGVLLALLLSAVQSSRESARQVQCQNNLRQSILAIQSFHNSERALPSFYNGTALSYPLKEWDLFHMHSWRVPLLPYLEQGSLKQQINMKMLATSGENEAVGHTEVSSFLCPSGGDPGELGWGLKHEMISIPQEDLEDKHRYSLVRSDYDAMAGIQVLPKTIPDDASPHETKFVRWGIWGWPVFDRDRTTGSHLRSYRQGKFRDVTDGLSHTLALVERTGKPYSLKNGKRNPTPENPRAFYNGQAGWIASNTFVWSINSDGVGVNESNEVGIYSFHPGGAYVAIADGSVRFLSDSTDFETLAKLYGRSDGGLPK
ncbi:MAG: DUF1559 domain-containing protein [Planctomycetota bacterium]